MIKPRLIILANGNDSDHQLWAEACARRGDKIDFEVVDFSHHRWLQRIIDIKANYYLSRPPGLISALKQLYDERLYIIAKVLNRPVYPSYEECLIYENKRFLYSWLASTGISHPATYVFYNKEEATDFLQPATYPLVAKANIGASGSGVKILYSKSDAIDYIRQAFEGIGAPKRWGPNLEKGALIKRGIRYVLHPSDISKRLNIYRIKKNESQKGFVIFQDYVEHDFEWRVVRIGESFFAHKKLKAGEKTSGSLIKGYENPPIGLMNFVRDITDKHQFFSQAVDIFEDKNRGFLINEMQCIFGQSDPYQMLVDGKPGRYRYEEDKWFFEEGDFARNACFDLRLEFVLSQID